MSNNKWGWNESTWWLSAIRLLFFFMFFWFNAWVCIFNPRKVTWTFKNRKRKRELPPQKRVGLQQPIFKLDFGSGKQRKNPKSKKHKELILGKEVGKPTSVQVVHFWQIIWKMNGEDRGSAAQVIEKQKLERILRDILSLEAERNNEAARCWRRERSLVPHEDG